MNADTAPTSAQAAAFTPPDTGWFYRARYTPLRDVLRGQMSARLDARLVIAHANLPTPLADITWRVIRGTRLWRIEKVAVAEELTSHFLDGLDVGKTTDELLAAFGDPRVAAKLIRRAKKRARPMTWIGFKWAAIFTVAVLALYLLLWATLHLRSPASPTRYYAELRARIAAIPAEQKGWSEYQRIYATYNLASINISELYEQGTFHRAPTPDDTSWDHVESILAQHRVGIEALYGVAEYEYADAPLGFWIQASDDQVAMFLRPGGQIHRYTTHTPLESIPISVPMNNGSNVTTPSLHAGLVMSAELNSAVHNRHRERTLRASRALVGFARQQSNGYENVWSSGSRALRLASGLLLPVVTLLENDHEWLTEADLTELAHLIASLQPIYRPNMSLIRLMADDGLERIYDANGRITVRQGDFRPSFAHEVQDMFEFRWLGVLLGSDLLGQQVGARVMFPVVMHMAGDRDEMRAEIERFISATERDLQSPLWELDQSGSYVALMKEWNASFVNKIHYLPMQYVPLGYVSVLQLKRQQAYQEAVLTRLALEMYHRRHGSYPSDLAELAPMYLPSTPVDHSTGRPLLMKLDEAGKPVLYGRGRDGVDDGGMPAEDSKTYREPRKDGDWIMLPFTLN